MLTKVSLQILDAKSVREGKTTYVRPEFLERVSEREMKRFLGVAGRVDGLILADGIGSVVALENHKSQLGLFSRPEGHWRWVQERTLYLVAITILSRFSRADGR